MTGRLRSIGCAVAVCLAVVVGACTELKPPSTFEQDFEDRTKDWKEVETQLPPPPRADNLVPFGVSGAASFHFAIDAYSLSIGSDGVFRYVLVATSPGGVRNVSYEGIRCETSEKKIYAIGRPDGTWVRSRIAAWTPIDEVGLNRQHAALMKEYFCPQAYPARNVPEILARLRVVLPSTVW